MVDDGTDEQRIMYEALTFILVLKRTAGCRAADLHTDPKLLTRLAPRAFRLVANGASSEASYEFLDTVDTSRSQERYSNALAGSQKENRSSYVS